jgi:hypothetical protein
LREPRLYQSCSAEKEEEEEEEDVHKINITAYKKGHAVSNTHKKHIYNQI